MVSESTVNELLKDFLHNFTQSLEKANEDRSEIKGSEDLFNIDIYINYLLCGIIAVFGSANNVINMIIFYRLGLKDSMSVGLMALSVTDFLASFVGLSGIAYIIVDKFVPESVIEPLSINHVSFGWLRDLLFLCSAWITTVLSIERCVCVVFPFKVKEIFTRVRCLAAVVIIYTVIISSNLPIFLSHWLVWTKVEFKIANETVLKDRLVVKYAANRRQIQLVVDVFTGAIIPIPSQVLVLISVIWMIHGLRVSSRVRHGTTTVSKSGADGKLSQKEARLVKVVLFLAIILTICNTPRFLAVYAKQIFPEVAFGNKSGHVHVFMWNLVVWTTNINSAAHFFVYLIVNASYRAKFREMFNRKAYTGTV